MPGVCLLIVVDILFPIFLFVCVTVWDALRSGEGHPESAG